MYPRYAPPGPNSNTLAPVAVTFNVRSYPAPPESRAGGAMTPEQAQLADIAQPRVAVEFTADSDDATALSMVCKPRANCQCPRSSDDSEFSTGIDGLRLHTRRRRLIASQSRTVFT